MWDARDPFSEFRLPPAVLPLPFADPEAAAAHFPELALLPASLFPITDDADLARKQLAAHVWQTRLSMREQLAVLRLAATTPLAGVAPRLAWRNVFWLVFVPPSGVVHLYGQRAFKWRLYGGAAPLYQEGWSDARACANLFVGWGLSFAAVDVLVDSDEHVRAVFDAFPARS